MPNAIGTNVIDPLGFIAELDAAGLRSLPFAWGRDGQFQFTGAITDQQQAAVLAVYAAHNPAKAALRAYANDKQWQLAIGGYTVTFSGGLPVVTFDTSTEGQALLTGKVARLAQANPPTTFSWQTGPTTFATLTADQLTTAGIKIADFVQGTFDALAAAMAGIDSGSITTTDQVDAVAWPANAVSL